MTDRTEDSEATPDADVLWRPESERAASTGASVQAPAGDSVPPKVEPVGGEHGDSPWSSGSDAVFAAPPASDSDVPTNPAPTERGATTVSRVLADGEVVRLASTGSRGRRWIAVAVVGALAVASGLVVRSILTFDLAADLTSRTGGTSGAEAFDSASEPMPFVTEPFAGADRRRLPASLDQRWRVDVEGVVATGRTRLSVLDDGAVVGVFDDSSVEDGQPGSVVALLDGADGTQRWRTAFDSEARAFDILGGFDDVIVMERLDTENRAVIGLAADTGEVRWTRDTNDPGVHVVLEGTPLVARVSFTVNARLTFIDPATGDEVGRVPGRLFATDFLGTWYVRNGRSVSRLDLVDGWNPPTPFETLWIDDNEPASVVGGRLIAIDDGRLEALGADGAPTSVATVGAAQSGGFAGPDIGTTFTQLSPMVGDSFVAVGSRSVFGAELNENGEADVRWRATGTPIESRPTDRGLALVVAAAGGASQSVVDASTGREIAVVEMAPGSVAALRLVGNGVVVKQSAQLGVERVGLDLDGNRLWSLIGDGPLAIGDGLVVTYGPSDAGIAVTAYGEAAP